MRRVLLLPYVLAMSLAAPRLASQQVRPAALQAGIDTTHRVRPGALATSGRAVSAVIGATAGALAGAYLVYQATRPDCTGPRGFCGTDPAVFNAGFALGFVPGATLGAGLPGWDRRARERSDWHRHWWDRWRAAHSARSRACPYPPARCCGWAMADPRSAPPSLCTGATDRRVGHWGAGKPMPSARLARSSLPNRALLLSAASRIAPLFAALTGRILLKAAAIERER